MWLVYQTVNVRARQHQHPSNLWDRT